MNSIYGLMKIVPPLEEPINLAEAKNHLRIATPDDDTLIAHLITVVREQAEQWLGRTLIETTYELVRDAAPEECVLELPCPPLISVESIEFYDQSDHFVLFNESDYFVDPSHQPGRIILRYGVSWPIILRPAAGMKIQYKAGYGRFASDVPSAIRQGMLIHLSSLYAERGDRIVSDGRLATNPLETIPLNAFTLYAPYRLLHLC